MPEIEDTFAYHFEAEDAATPVMTSAEQVFLQAAGRMEAGFERLAGAIEGSTDQIGTGMEDVAASVVRTASVMGGLSRVAGLMGDGVRRLGIGFEFAATRLEGFGAAGRGAAGILRGLSGSLGGAGLLGFVLGPIAPLVGLLKPVVDIVEKTLAPAFEVLGTAIENALAPISFILETSAQAFVPMLQEFLAPAVNFLTEAAVQMGVFLQGLGRQGVQGALGPITETFARLLPVAMRVLDAIGRLGASALPVVLRAIDKLAPIVAAVVEIVADQLIVRLNGLMDLITDVGPDLVDLAADLLEAFLPVVKVVVDLGAELLKAILGPIPRAGLKEILQRLKNDVVPEVKAFLLAFSQGLRDLKALASTFFDVISAGVRAVAQIADPIVGRLREARGLLGGLVEQPAPPTPTTAPARIVEQVGDTLRPRTVVGKAPPPQPSRTVAEATGEAARRLLVQDLTGTSDPRRKSRTPQFDIAPPRGFAEGGIVMGPTRAIVGERGPEVVLPLDAATLRSVLVPALGDIRVPGLSDAVRMLADIREALQHMLRAHAGALAERARAGEHAPRDPWSGDASDLAAVPGLAGLGG